MRNGPQAMGGSKQATQSLIMMLASLRFSFDLMDLTNAPTQCSLRQQIARQWLANGFGFINEPQARDTDTLFLGLGQ